MADVPQTYAQWAAYGGTDIQSKFILNTLIANDPFLGMIPVQNWPGGNKFEWYLNKTLPTVAAIDETSTMESTAAARYAVSTQLAQYGGDVEIPIFNQSTQDALMNLEAQEVTDLIRAGGRLASSEVIQGNYIDESAMVIGTGIIGTGVTGLEGIVSVDAVSANMPEGYGGLQYTHVGTTLAFRAPGSTTYGTAVAIGADAAKTLTDGDDPTKSITITPDDSDFTAGAVDIDMPGALLFPRPAEIAGLREWSQLDSNQVFAAAGAAGDAITLANMDKVEEAVLGPKSDKIYLCNARTRRALKALIGAVGGMRQGEFQGRDLSKYDLNYEGVPIIASPGVVTTDVKGGSGATLGKVYCLRLNTDVGFHLFAGSQTGPNTGTMGAVSDHDVEGGPVAVPGVYLRRLGERENAATYKWRLTMALAGVLKRSSSCAVLNDISS